MRYINDRKNKTDIKVQSTIFNLIKTLLTDITDFSEPDIRFTKWARTSYLRRQLYVYKIYEVLMMCRFCIWNID